MPKLYQLSRAVSNATKLPAVLSGRAIAALFNFKVRFAGTGGIAFEEPAEGRAGSTSRTARKCKTISAAFTPPR